MQSETPRQRLFAAAWRGEEIKVKDIILKEKVPINAWDENHVTALRFTAQYGHYDLTVFLLDHGADPNIKAHDKIDPLLAAIEKGHKEIVQLLLQRGANIHSQAKGTNGLLLSREKGHTEIEAILLEAGAKEKLAFWQDKKCSIT
ncbi:hypothetical protein TCAL_00689 [Tigriopus californicus]|uniref:Uncharacterized protein n=1 Tax=Tigriopus californicus TaxID=6832 RepID=A0A553PC72_TIGCA|nr:ankyrin repeat domain-containing protein 29-like [Tigriopus californicus]TRY75285.1 hypothetical protein TCAL_00689 [Tigriopus californicus]|eukprot:TCALIF_00689-PA protein Name:"Similar to ANKRD29 Ankyrin repeat domain-containing protein 29 (Homo sapiens)" AED:0.13 eAED:0.13 QI:0/-1/0/1/-1/1/1/0/144